MVYLSSKSKLLLAKECSSDLSSMREFAIMNDIDWEGVVVDRNPIADSSTSYAESLITEAAKDEKSFLEFLDYIGAKENSSFMLQVNKDLAETKLQAIMSDDHQWELVEISQTGEDDDKPEESIESSKSQTNHSEIKKPKPQLVDTHKLDLKQEERYLEILKIINESGKSMEIQASTFEDNEEKLRNQLVTILRTHLQPMASVTAESLNREGKTDILVRENSNNLFIAECKIWSGRKDLSDALTQLLSYTNWRDPFTAIILFSKNKKISTILDDVQKEIPEHVCHDALIGNLDKSWFYYKVHLPDDKKIEMRLAVLIFKLS